MLLKLRMSTGSLLGKMKPSFGLSGLMSWIFGSDAAFPKIMAWCGGMGTKGAEHSQHLCNTDLVHLLCPPITFASDSSQWDLMHLTVHIVTLDAS